MALYSYKSDMRSSERHLHFVHIEPYTKPKSTVTFRRVTTGGTVEKVTSNLAAQTVFHSSMNSSSPSAIEENMRGWEPSPCHGDPRRLGSWTKQRHTVRIRCSHGYVAGIVFWDSHAAYIGKKDLTSQWNPIRRPYGGGMGLVIAS